MNVGCREKCQADNAEQCADNGASGHKQPCFAGEVFPALDHGNTEQFCHCLDNEFQQKFKQDLHGWYGGMAGI